MTNIEITTDFLKEFDKLLQDFTFFKGVNLIHADQFPTNEKEKNIVKELITESLKGVEDLNKIFKQPLLNHFNHNKDILSKNLQNILKHMYEYFIYADPRIKFCDANVQDRFSKTKEHYSKFMKKYFN